MNTSHLETLPPEWEAMAMVFSALGDAHRQKILLLFEPNEILSAGQIAAVSTLSRSTVSHHLKILKQAHVLECKKFGKEVYYRIQYDTIKHALHGVLDYVSAQHAPH